MFQLPDLALMSQFSYPSTIVSSAATNDLDGFEVDSFWGEGCWRVVGGGWNGKSITFNVKSQSTVRFTGAFKPKTGVKGGLQFQPIRAHASRSNGVHTNLPHRLLVLQI